MSKGKDPAIKRNDCFQPMGTSFSLLLCPWKQSSLELFKSSLDQEKVDGQATIRKKKKKRKHDQVSLSWSFMNESCFSFFSFSLSCGSSVNNFLFHFLKENEFAIRAEARLVFRLMAQPTADIKDVPSRKRKTKRTFSFHFFKKWKISVGSSVDCFLLRENYVQSTGSYPRRLFLS